MTSDDYCALRGRLTVILAAAKFAHEKGLPLNAGSMAMRLEAAIAQADAVMSETARERRRRGVLPLTYVQAVAQAGHE